MKFGLNSKGQNPICKAILKRKFSGNNILKIKSYAKTIDVRISEISIVIGDHVDKVYIKPNKVFSEIKDVSKRARN